MQITQASTMVFVVAGLVFVTVFLHRDGFLAGFSRKGRLKSAEILRH